MFPGSKNILEYPVAKVHTRVYKPPFRSRNWFFRLVPLTIPFSTEVGEHGNVTKHTPHSKDCSTVSHSAINVPFRRLRRFRRRPTYGINPS